MSGSTITNSEVDTYIDGGVITATTNAIQFGVVLRPITGTLSMADVQGSYTFVYRGDVVNHPEGVTNTIFWIMLGRCTFDSSGNATAIMTRSERGVVSTDTFNGKYDIVSKDIGDGDTIMAVKVIRMFDASAATNAEKENGPKIILASDKSVGIVYQAPTMWEGGEEKPNRERGLGMAVKHK